MPSSFNTAVAKDSESFSEHESVAQLPFIFNKNFSQCKKLCTSHDEISLFFCAFLSSLMFEFPSSICFTLMESLKCSWELHNLQLLHIIENGGCEDFSVTKSITKCFMHTSKMNIFHACSPCKRIMNSL